MKKLYLLLLLPFFFTKGFSQLIPSTVGEVYNFEVGDSFLYEAWPPGQYVLPNYYWKIIIQKTISGNSDTIFYTYYGNINDTFYNLSSSVLRLPLADSCNLWGYCSFDSVYVDSSKFGRKANSIFRGYVGLGGDDTIYHEGLGMTRDCHFSDDLNLSGPCEEMIYYHKASGQIWGLPLISDIISDQKPVQRITLFPNPVTGRFVLHYPFQLQSNFLLFDVLGNKVKHEPITNATTTLQRDNLTNGIYFWQVESEGKILDRGKIVFE